MLAPVDDVQAKPQKPRRSREMHTEHAINATDLPRPTGPGSPTPTGAYPDSDPVLWQLQVSHFVEKVRWALDYKRIPHIRQSLLPGLHAIKTRRLSGDISTTPVLTLDGRSIGDSTRIIAAIEERWPQPPLYPEDEAQRCRALELEEFFDEELGPHIRRAFYHEVLPRPELVVPLFTQGRRRPPRALLLAGFPALRVAMRRRFEISAESAAHSRAKMVAAMDRLEREISSSGYLVGDSFTVADLTAATLFYGVARPPGVPVSDGRRRRPARFVARVS
jgi:glutathione S-transferase